MEILSANVANYIIGIFQMILISIFGNILFSTKPKTTFERTIILILSPAAIFLANMLGLNWFNFLVSITVVLFIFFSLFEARWYWLTLAGVASITALGFCEGATAFLATMILQDKMGRIVSNSISSTIIALISTLVFAILVWAVRLIIFKMGNGRNTIYLSSNIGVIVLLVVSVVVASYTVYVDSFTDFDSNLSLFGFIILLALILVDAYFIFGNEHDRKHYRMQNEVLTARYREEQLAALVAQQEEYIEKLKSTSHDFKKHLYTIKELTVQELEPTTLRYIEDMIETVEDTADYSDFNNKALDVILSTLRKKCEAEGIEYASSIHHHDFSFMSFKDVCTLFANAIDNAHDACLEMGNYRSRRFIDLSILRQNEVVVIEIANSKSHEIKASGQQILTTKLAESIHGYGLKNMREITHSYNGDIFCEFNENSFTLTITLEYPMPEK